MAGIKSIKITCTQANTAYNVVTGTTAAPTLPRDVNFVGEEATFQNQTTGSVATVGASDIIINCGIILASKGAAETVRGHNPSAIQLQEWWVSSDTPGGIVVVQLRKRV